MPFTNSEAYQIRKYLGYPQVYRQANPRLESAIEQVGLDPDAVADVQALLAKIAALQTVIDQEDTFVAGLKSVDNQEVEWYQDKNGSSNGPLMAHWQQGNSLCNQLSIIFGVPIENRIFGTRGYTGDNWKQFSGSSCPDGGRSSFNFSLGRL